VVSLVSRYVAISLKVPDNEAYTALTTLQRLGINIARIERSRIIPCHPEEPARAGVSKDELANQIMRDESIFNPNIHTLEILDANTPRAGELWIEPLETTSATPNSRIGWRLYRDDNTPADRTTLEVAAERLLCNPAFQRVLFA
jgi:phosphoribosylformylglycinamidine (FGAM) synthase PurS component